MKTVYLLLIIATLLLFTSSCAELVGKSTKFYLKHPETYDYVECNEDNFGSVISYKTNEECVQYYQDKGYVIWGDL